ncbi:discoidin domain-containing protein [Fodinicola acaciae]|uniref:discoidin domain-containing protein n=1 Tax=Fodinicola acaciae TaxID=2681555 RepID=UPI0013CF43A4|nr:discoidin domain-containing protein [Fodinicola acaciae]
MPAALRMFVVAAVAATTVAIAAPSQAAPAPVTSVWTENSSVNVFQDSLPQPGSSTAINLTMARNEYEAAQIAIRRSAQFTIQNVSFGNLTSGANTLAATNLAYQFVEFEHLNHNTIADFEQWPLDNPIRSAPGDFPDALSNDTSLTVPANQTAPIWIRAYVPAATPAGVYTGTATVVSNAGNTSVPVTVDVRDVTIPNAAQSSFTTAMWMRQLGPLDLGQTDIVKDTYGITKYSADWWALMDKVAASMRAYRLNSLSLPLITLMLDGKSYLDGSTYHFNWTYFDQVVDRFMSTDHAVNQLEGFGWFYNWDGTTATSDIIGGTPTAPVRTAVQSDTAQAKRWQTQFITALRDHVRAKGWESRFWMHVSDEVQTDTSDRYRAACDTIHSIWPQVRIADANNVQESQENVADKENFLVPNLMIANDHPDYYAGAGKPFWLYTANIPTGSYLNRFIDQPVYAQREMMWYAYTLGATGYLHWAYDAWDYAIDDEDTKGDGWIVKADTAHKTIKPTIRLESLRDGIEDWELLKIVGQAKPALAKGISTALVTDATRYNQDTGFVTRMHNALVAAAAGGRTFSTALTANANPSASSGSAPGNAIDADPATSWKSTAGGSQWWQVDLTRQAQVDAVKLTWGSGYPSSYKVQLSYDGTTFADAYATTANAGGDTFAAINGKARYIRIAASNCPAAGCALADVQIGGAFLASPNLAGGKSYDEPDPDPAYPDHGYSTDGVLAGHFDDHRSYGYHVGTSGTFTATITIDLETTATLGSVRIHRYQKYEDYYEPNSVVVSTSTDNQNFAQKANVTEANGTDGLWYDLTFPPTDARYVRVTFAKTGGGHADWLFLDEIEAYAPPAGQQTDLAQGAGYTISEEPDPRYPDTDGRESTDGVVAGGYTDGHGYGFIVDYLTAQPMTIDIDLPAQKHLNRVKVAKYDDGGEHNYAPDRVDIYTSTDGSTYTYRGSALWPTGQWYDITFPDTVAGHVRVALSKTSGANADWLFVDEIAAY